MVHILLKALENPEDLEKSKIQNVNYLEICFHFCTS